MNEFPADYPVNSRMEKGWKRPLHVVELNRELDRTILFLHGNPTWSFLYRNQLIPLSDEGYHLMAPDLPGFGRSGKWTDPSDVSFRSFVASITHLVKEKNPSELIVVGHDWGGPIGLETAFIFQDRLSGIMLINSGTFFDLKVPWYFRLGMKKGVGELLFGRLNGFVEVGLRIGCIQRQRLRPDVMKQYRYPFQHPEERAAIVAFPRMIPTGPSHRKYDRFQTLHRQSSELDVPVGIISGRNDPVFGPSYGRRMKEVFPKGVHGVIDRGSHFLQEDRPERLSRFMKAFLETV